MAVLLLSPGAANKCLTVVSTTGVAPAPCRLAGSRTTGGGDATRRTAAEPRQVAQAQGSRTRQPAHHLRAGVTRGGLEQALGEGCAPYQHRGERAGPAHDPLPRRQAPGVSSGAAGHQQRGEGDQPLRRPPHRQALRRTGSRRRTPSQWRRAAARAGDSGGGRHGAGLCRRLGSHPQSQRW